MRNIGCRVDWGDGSSKVNSIRETQKHVVYVTLFSLARRFDETYHQIYNKNKIRIQYIKSHIQITKNTILSLYITQQVRQPHPTQQNPLLIKTHILRFSNASLETAPYIIIYNLLLHTRQMYSASSKPHLFSLFVFVSCFS